PDMSIDATTRIPPRRVGWIVETDHQLVRSAENHVWRQIDAPRNIAERPAADDLPVQPDGRVGHCAVDVEKDRSSGVRGGDVELLPIPPDAWTGQAPHAARWARGQERPRDRPIVRQVH